MAKIYKICSLTMILMVLVVGRLSAQLNGTYTIGPSGNYTSFTAAISALQSSGVSGPVTFNVANGTYNSALTIPAITGASSTNRITFQSASGDSSLVILTSSGTTVNMNGADYFTFRKMTVQTTAGKCFDFIGGATYNIVENCRVLGYNIASTSTLYYAIGSSNTTTNDSYNTIRNNFIQYGSYGIYWYGNSTSPYEPGLVVQNNNVVDAYNYGAYVQYVDAPLITQNIFDVRNSIYTTSYAFRLNNSYNSSVFSRNSCYGRYMSAYFGSIVGTSSLRASIVNNEISGERISAGALYGFYTTSVSYADIYHNSVLTVNSTGNNTCYAFYNGSSTYTNVINNIFRDSSVAGTSNYSAYLSPSTGTIYDYNDYLVTTGSSNLAYHGSYGSFTPSMFTTFRNSSYGGSNSVMVEPAFMSITDLRAYSPALNVGTNLISTVPTDRAGIARTNPVSIGAFEYDPVSLDAGISQLLTSLPCPGSNAITVTLRNFGSTTLTSATINWSVNSVNQTPYAWTGSLASGGAVNVTIGTYNFISGNYTFVISSANPNGQTDGNNGNNSTTRTLGVALGGTYTIGATGNYTNFTAAVNALVSNGVCGPVTFNVQNGSYSEAITIPQIAGSSATNRITFQGLNNDSSLVTLSSASTYPVNLNGADYITFRKMTMQTTASAYVMFYQNACVGVRVENCRLIGINTTSTSTALSLVYNSSTGTNDMDNEFRNNRFENGSYGIYWQGFTSSPYEGGFIVENNRFINQAYQIIFLNYMNAPVIRNNYMDNTMNTYATSWGIYLQYCYNGTVITGNDIRSKVYGMNLYYLYGTSGSPVLVSNNFVNVTHGTGTTIYGVYSYYGDYHNFYHNTITTSNGTSTSASSYTLYDSYGTYKNYQNNIFRNNGPAGTANFSAYLLPSTGSVYDYNDYFVPSGSTYLAYHSSNGNFTPAAWTTFRASNFGGANSLNINPNFISSVDLRHSNTALNAGQNLLSVVSTDIDGRTRYVPVTIGGYDYKPANDAGVAVILTNPPCTGNQPVRVQIQNFGTSNLNSCTINWSVNSVNQTPFSFSGSLAQNVISGTLTIGSFNFLSSTNYTITAWTTSPNGVSDGNTSNDQRSITATSASMSGTYTIGATGNYTSFASAISAMQTNGICGPVTFNVQNGTYTENITIPQINGANAINRITFQSLNNDSTLVTLTSSTTYPVYLNGADYVTFRKMTLQTTAASYVIYFLNTCVGNRVENCRLIGQSISSTSTSYALVYNSTTATNDANNEFRNNRFLNGTYGIYWQGLTSAPYEAGFIAEDNQFINQAYQPIFLTYMSAPIIRGNLIDNSSHAYASSWGMYIQYCYNGADISRNDIRTKVYGMNLYYLYGTSNARVQVTNNLVNVIHPTGTTLYGIYNWYGDFHNIFHNTVSVTNPNTSTSYPVYDYYGTFKTYYNNIFRNNSIAGSGNYAAYLLNSTGTVYDYNDYWNHPSSTNFAYHGSWGTFTNSQWSTFRSSSYGGANSVNVDPVFVSTTNLRHSNNALNVGFNLLSTVPVDFEGRTRVLPMTIGATEYKPVANDAGGMAILNNPPCQGVQPMVVTINNYGNNTLSSATINWSMNGVNQTAYNWTGSLAPNTISPTITIGNFNFITSTTYLMRVWTSSPNGVSDGNVSNDTVTLSAGTALGGTYTIGTSGNYTSFTAAVNALQTFGVCAPVTFNVLNGTYNEAITIPQINGVSSINRITFQSQNNDSTLVTLTSASTYPVYLNGADYITFRKMTLQTTAPAYVVYMLNTCVGNRIENCRLNGFASSSTTTAYSIIFNSTTGNNDADNEFRNNVFNEGTFAFYWTGFTSAPYEGGLIIENNRFINQAYKVMYLTYLNAPVIRNNYIDNSAHAYASSWGIDIRYCYNNTLITQNDIRAKVYGLYVYYLYGSGGQNALISNNFVNVTHPTGTTLYGIYSYYGDYTNYYHNTVVVTNPVTTATSYALYSEYGTYKVFTNNIFDNNSVGGANNFVAYFYSSTGTTLDFNDYWYNSGTTNLAYHSSYGTFTTSQWTTFRNASYGGGNSINVDPLFISTTNLRHFNGNLNVGTNLLSAVPVDIDGRTRTAPITIGASEYKPVANDASISSIVTVPPCSGVNPVQVILSSYGTSTLTGATINWSVNGITQPP
jgi:hypothetical protein